MPRARCLPLRSCGACEMAIEPLWGEAHERCSLALLDAARDGELTTGMLAIEGLEGEAASGCRETIRTWANEVRHRCNFRGPHLRAETLVEVLVDEENLCGDKGDYYNPHNSFLSSVLERRRGLPIVLSAIWMDVGRLAGMEIEGVALPGHFIVRVEGQLRDPFNKGELMTPDQCVELVSRLTNGNLPWDDRFLEPVAISTILERMLRNLINSYNNEQTSVALYRVVRSLALLSPTDSNGLMYARVTEMVGAQRMAIDLYEALIESSPGSPEASAARKFLAPLYERSTLLN